VAAYPVFVYVVSRAGRQVDTFSFAQPHRARDLDFLQAIREILVVLANVPETSDPTRHIRSVQSVAVSHRA